MDLPIKVIIILFVSLVVGLTVVQFAKNTMLDSQLRMNEFGKKDIPKESVVELSSMTPQQIAYLADECSKRTQNLQRTLCFAVHSTNQFTFNVATKNEISSAWTSQGHVAGDLIISPLLSDTTAIFIYYNLLGKVEITK